MTETTPTTTRVPYTEMVFLRESHALIMRKRGGGERRIPAGKWWIDRATPVGDDAELIERMPHNGYRYLDRRDLIAVEMAQ